MATESVNYQCPACMAPLRFSSETGRLECDFCDSSFDVAEIDKEYAANHEKANESASQTASSVDYTSYTCSSCGAELICEPTTAISECPYCGNPAVVPGRVTGKFAPDHVIPFKLDYNAAREALRNHYKGKILLPGSFKEENHIEKLQGVYVPFWLYDANAHGDAEFDGQKERLSHRDKDGDETKIVDHYKVERIGDMRFERIPVDGASHMPDDHMDAIEPFDYSELVPFSVGYLPGYAADMFDQDCAECRHRAERRIIQSTEDALKESAQGYTNVVTKRFDVSVSWDSASFAMLPVYMLNTKWKDKSYLFAMNGQTGRLIGDLPVSKPKAIIITLAVFIVVCALVALFTVFGASPNDSFADKFAPPLGIGTFAAGLVITVLLSRMKSTGEAKEASMYLQKETFNLTYESDVYVNRTID